MPSPRENHADAESVAPLHRLQSTVDSLSHSLAAKAQDGGDPPSQGLSKFEYEDFFRQANVLLPEVMRLVDQGLLLIPEMELLGVTGQVQVQRDLMFLANAVARADGDFNEKEWLLLADLFVVLLGIGRLKYFDATFLERQETVAGMTRVFERMESVTRALSSVPGWQWEYTSDCITMMMLRSHDEMTGTRHATTFQSFANRFARLIAQADGEINSQEKEAMLHVATWLRRLPSV